MTLFHPVQDRSLSRRRPSVLRSAVLAIAAITMTAGTTLAQDGDRGSRRGGFMRGGPMGQLFRPEFIRRDLELIDDELELDEGQGTIVETLLFDYDAAFTEAVEAMRDRFTELRPERPEGWEEQRAERQKLFGEMRTIRREMRDLREKAEDGEIDPEMMEKLQARMDPLREKMREMRPPMPEGAELERLRESMGTLTKQWRAERAAIRREFMSNLQAVMNEEQLESWSSFEQALRREKTLDQGRLSGERQDLFVVLREAGYPDQDRWRIKDALDGYAISLDAALSAREDFLAESQMEIFGAMMAGETERATKLLEREAALRVAVRDTNERYVETIAARVSEEMPGAVSDAFRTGFQKRAYGRIFQPTASQRAFQIAQQFEGMDDDTIVALMTLEESYLTELAELNRQLVQLTRQYEPDRNARRMERRMSWMRGEGRRGRDAGEQERELDPIQEGFERRDELSRKYQTMLESHLTPEQIAELPKPERRERGRFGEGRGDRGDRGARGDRGRRDRGGAEGRNDGERRQRRRDVGDA